MSPTDRDTMPSDTMDTTMVTAPEAGAEPSAAEQSAVAPANAPFQPDEEMHISPHPPKQPLYEAQSPEVTSDHDMPPPKRSRPDDSHRDRSYRRSRSPQPRSSPRDELRRDRDRDRRTRSHSRSRSRSWSRSSSRSFSRRSSYSRRSKSPERRRSHRDSTPPSQRRRSSGSYRNAIPEPEPREVRRKTDVSQEERKRSQRLFGGLFGGPGRPAKSRLAGRQQTQKERRASTGEDRRSDAEHQLKIERTRLLEQLKIEEKKMNTSHASDLMGARALQTNSRPFLHYRPAKLSEEQKKTIDDQVTATKSRISKEKNDFQKEKQARLAKLDVQYLPKESADEPANLPAKISSTQPDVPPKETPREVSKDDTDMETAPQQEVQQSPNAMTDEPAAGGEVKTKATEPPSNEAHTGLEPHDDKDKYDMVVHEEDTVIY